MDFGNGRDEIKARNTQALEMHKRKEELAKHNFEIRRNYRPDTQTDVMHIALAIHNNFKNLPSVHRDAIKFRLSLNLRLVYQPTCLLIA